MACTVAVAVTAVSITAACASRSSGKSGGKFDPSLPADQVMRAAAQSILAAKGVHVHGTFTGTDGSGGTVAISDTVIDGVIQFAPKPAADVSLTAKPNDDAKSSRMIYAGTTIYTKLPADLHAKVAAKPNATWFEEAASDSPIFGSHLPSDLSDPAELVSDLLAKSKFAKVGAETVDGVPAVHYAADFATDPSTHVEVWLTDSGLPVELKLEPNAAHDLCDLHFTDWGEPVKITVPKADEVMSPTDQISFSVSGSGFTLSPDQLGSTSFASGTPSSSCVPVRFTLPATSGTSASPGTACIDIGSLKFPTPSPLPTATGS